MASWGTEGIGCHRLARLSTRIPAFRRFLQVRYGLDELWMGGLYCLIVGLSLRALFFSPSNEHVVSVEYIVSMIIPSLYLRFQYAQHTLSELRMDAYLTPGFTPLAPSHGLSHTFLCVP